MKLTTEEKAKLKSNIEKIKAYIEESIMYVNNDNCNWNYGRRN